MAYHRSEMQEHFSIPEDDAFSGAWGYDKNMKYNLRQNHNPWTWWHVVERDNYPHVTVYKDDFDAAGKLKSFHISYGYNGHKAKVVHVYYKADRGKVWRSGVDANRVGYDSEDAREDFFANKEVYDELAKNFVRLVFPAANPI